MVNLLNKYKTFVGFIFKPSQLDCFWAQSDGHHSQLKALQIIPLSALQLQNLSINNPKQLTIFLQQFLQQHKLKKQPIIFALASQGVIEHTLHPNKSLETDEIAPFAQQQLPELSTIIWDYTLNNNDLFIAGIAPALLAQYQLLAVNAKINCVKITTEKALYKGLASCGINLEEEKRYEGH